MKKRSIAIASSIGIALFVASGVIGGDPFEIFDAAVAMPAANDGRAVAKVVIAPADPATAARGLQPLLHLISDADRLAAADADSSIAISGADKEFPKITGFGPSGSDQDPGKARFLLAPESDTTLKNRLAGLRAMAIEPAAKPRTDRQLAFDPQPIAVSTVPDNATWATLLSGLLLVGMTMRLRGRVRPVLA